MDNSEKTTGGTGDNKNDKVSRLSRREVLAGLATVPVLGAFAYAYLRKRRYDKLLRDNILRSIDIPADSSSQELIPVSGKRLRLGIIGFGIRGPQIAKAAGFMHPTEIDILREAASKNSNDTRYAEFMEQDDLNIEIRGVCDIFSTYAEFARATGANTNRGGTDGKAGDSPVIYKNYKDLISSPEIDAVIIATPDHWHAPMAIEAAKAGKHVYCEKPMSWSVEETYELRKVIRETGIVFQLGHQGRQTEAYQKAKEAISRGVIGKVNLIEVTTNRNDPNGAWVYPIHPDANPETIDWAQFTGQAPWHEFSLERFFRWRCWWDYSTGLSGDLLTHEYDAMNQIFGFGIPDTAVSSGGIYYFKDGRTVPDVLHTVFEFEEKELTMLYSATLASGRSRGKVIMGHDGSMEVSNSLTVYADRASTKYKVEIAGGVIDPLLPIMNYTPGRKKIDAVTSATEQYFAGRGLLYTYRGGRRLDTTHLHIREWLNCIRNGGTPSCNVDQGFEEAITAHMGTIAYHEGRKVRWDKEKETII